MMLEYVYTNYHESAETAVVNTLSQAPVKLFTAHLAKVLLDQAPGGQSTLIVTGLTPEQAIAATLGSEREKALEKLVQKALDEGWCDEWWYEDALKLGLEANY